MIERIGRTWMVRSSSTSGLIACAALMAACAGGVPDSYPDVSVHAEESALGGEALGQRKHDLARANDDMVAFHATLLSLIDRRDSRGSGIFEDFVADYIGNHLDPLLAPEWQSSHPEVMATDANLRFIKADVLVEMRYPRRVQRVIDDIERRYTGRGSLLIDYPVGDQNTLDEALVILKERKWGG